MGDFHGYIKETGENARSVRPAIEQSFGKENRSLAYTGDYWRCKLRVAVLT